MDILHEPYFLAVKQAAMVLHERNHGGNGKDYCHICFKETKPILDAAGIEGLLLLADPVNDWTHGQRAYARRHPERVHQPYAKEKEP